MSASEVDALVPRLFPDHASLVAPEEYERLYPPRPLPAGAMVVRIAPSPTGFMHIGVLSTAMINFTLARQSKGVFILRVEDTDTKREVAGAVDIIVASLQRFGFAPQEGYLKSPAGDFVDVGGYGPYLQSKRRAIYRAFALKLFRAGLAYPCFCSEPELTSLREQQTKMKVRPGYYGRFAKWRHATAKEVSAALDEGKSFVMRLRSPGDPTQRVEWNDGVKGKMSIPENDRDEVILKSDGLTTYHFAHAVDDHLMRTTHVIRSDEWIASVPLHIQLFRVLGWEPPTYVHLSPIQKLDQVKELNPETGVEEERESKRKLSKRKDPESNVEFFVERGFPEQAIIEYLMNIANSDFEDWRKSNPLAAVHEFQMKPDRFSTSGALYDMEKLTSISRDVVSRFSIEKIYTDGLAWANRFHAELAKHMREHSDYAKKAIGIERGGERPSKRIVTWADLPEQLGFFFDELFQKVQTFPFPEQLQRADCEAILKAYPTYYAPSDSKDQWFAKCKELAAARGFAPEVKFFKKEPGKYKGHIGDVTMIIRVAVCGSQKTPDLWEVMQVLGEARVRARLARWQ